MRALTVKQPWAWAILYSSKDIENRGWSTRYRGPLVIHSGARLHEYTKMPRGAPAVPDDFVFSAMLGVVELVDIVDRSRSKWFDGPLGWVLRNPRPFPSPIPCPGRLGLWQPSPGQLRAIARRLT